MRAKLLIVAVLLAAGLASAQESEPAQPAKVKTLNELVAERREVKKAQDGLKAAFEKLVADFQKEPATIKFNAAQARVRQSHQEVDKRLKELDSEIAEKVSKETKAEATKP